MTGRDVPRRSRPVGPPGARCGEVDRLARLISVHAGAVVERTGRMRGCRCMLCARAVKRLEEIRRGGQGIG